MIDAEFHQDPEGISARAIWVVAVGVVAVSAALIAIAWLLVVPPPPTARPVAAPSPLEHGLIDEAGGGAAIRAAGDRLLEQYQWVDRKAGVVRIPIDRAIDAVAADPRLIAAPRGGAVGAAATPALSRALGAHAGSATALPVEVQR
jgi:hypothetical protein